MREERVMLIVNDDHLRRARVKSLDEWCPYCSKALAAYPLIMSDESEQNVYHAACALQLATEILVDLFTFFHPPAPYAPLFMLTQPSSAPNREGGDYALNGS